ncbi:MAG: hypothetical protein ACI30B_04755 [Paludibacteraceae bacterium]
MKNFKFLAALCCMAAVFTACEKNEPNDNGVGIANGHEWVDLDLPSGLRWATCNVGATKPESYGYYLAWGETTTKSTYDWTTYKWCNGSDDTLTKYCTEIRYGTVDNKIDLEITDDAACTIWGGMWSIPTENEWQELIDNCTWKWTTRNGVKGYTVKSKTNGNSIFLPTAGFRFSNDLNLVGYYGEYWTRSLYAEDSRDAWYVYFNEDGVYRMNDGRRSCGQSVRPVLK